MQGRNLSDDTDDTPVVAEHLVGDFGQKGGSLCFKERDPPQLKRDAS